METFPISFKTAWSLSLEELVASSIATKSPTKTQSETDDSPVVQAVASGQALSNAAKSPRPVNSMSS
jgi:hypothetical protein